MLSNLYIIQSGQHILVVYRPALCSEPHWAMSWAHTAHTKLEDNTKHTSVCVRSCCQLEYPLVQAPTVCSHPPYLRAWGLRSHQPTTLWTDLLQCTNTFHLERGELFCVSCQAWRAEALPWTRLPLTDRHHTVNSINKRQTQGGSVGKTILQRPQSTSLTSSHVRELQDRQQQVSL
jgi:hypothetical protein